MLLKPDLAPDYRNNVVTMIVQAPRLSFMLPDSHVMVPGGRAHTLTFRNKSLPIRSRSLPLFIRRISFLFPLNAGTRYPPFRRLRVTRAWTPFASRARPSRQYRARPSVGDRARPSPSSWQLEEPKIISSRASF